MAAWAEFSIQSVTITNNNVRIAWFAPGGSNYVVQVANGNAGGFTNNFTDLSPVIFIPGTTEVLTNYTHINGALNATSRFYRVRSYSQPVLQSVELWPTNSIIPVGEVNRFKAYGRYTDGNIEDLTGLVTLTSLTPSLTTIRPTSNGFHRILGNASGMATVRVVYASGNVTSAIPQRVAVMSNFTVSPSTVQLTVGQSAEVRFFADFSSLGIFGRDQSSTEFDYQPTLATVQYFVDGANVANSYAVVTATSTASGDNFISGGGISQQQSFTWCSFFGISMSPFSSTISVGETQQFTVTGSNAFGQTDLTDGANDTQITSQNNAVAVHIGNGRVVGVSPGQVNVVATSFNQFGCNPLQDTAILTVVGPPTPQPTGTVLFQSSFEAGLEGFTIDNSFGAGSGLWHRSIGRALAGGHSASNSLYYGQGETVVGGGNYNAGNTAGVVTSPSINLVGVETPITLYFNYLLETENSQTYDQAVVEISANGGAFVPVAGNHTGIILTDPTGGLWKQAAVNLDAYAGSQIRVRFSFATVDGLLNAFEGWYVDDVDLRGPPSISNDNFSNRIQLSGRTTATSSTNMGATKETGEPDHWSFNSGGKSVWWRWTAPSSGQVTINTFSSNFDTLLAVYTGTAVNALTKIVENDDSSGTLQSQVQFTATAGTIYQIAVDGWSGAAGNIVLTISQ